MASAAKARVPFVRSRVIVLSLLFVSLISVGKTNEENLAETVKALREQVQALLEHRQEDYNALEENLKRAIERNTELLLLRNEVKQLRKEVNAFRGGSGNEAKNERLRIRWLGNTVTELRNEVAEVLRTRNASEELAERSRMRNELSSLKVDVGDVGKDVRNLGGRIAKIESTLGTLKIDIAAVKERAFLLSRACADVASQLSTVQIELKSKYEAPRETENEVKLSRHSRHDFSRILMHRVEERLSHLERKISLIGKKRGAVEKRLLLEKHENLSRRLGKLELRQLELQEIVANTSFEIQETSNSVNESLRRTWQNEKSLEEKADRASVKQELSRLEVNAARKSAELSLTREELSNLRKTVQALSVSASNLQEKSDRQQEAINRLNTTLINTKPLDEFLEIQNATKELEEAENRYRSMIGSLPSDCKGHHGLTMLSSGPGLGFLTFCRDEWVLIGRRTDGSLDFDRSWREYALGFGSPSSEFWLGNEAIHRFTGDGCASLRVDLVDIHGTFWRAEYQNFLVDSQETGYRICVSDYSGNATDAMSYHDGMAFSAKDRDLDVSSSNCADNYHGGWWFSHCQHANLNGKYSLGLTWFQEDRNRWMVVASSEMLVKRKENCR